MWCVPWLTTVSKTTLLWQLHCSTSPEWVCHSVYACVLMSGACMCVYVLLAFIMYMCECICVCVCVCVRAKTDKYQSTLQILSPRAFSLRLHVYRVDSQSNHTSAYHVGYTVLSHCIVLSFHVSTLIRSMTRLWNCPSSLLELREYCGRIGLWTRFVIAVWVILRLDLVHTRIYTWQLPMNVLVWFSCELNQLPPVC